MVRPTGGLQLPMPGAGPVAIPSSTKVHGEDHDRQLCFQIPRKSTNLQLCFQIPRKIEACIVLHPAWRPVAGFPGGAGTLGDFASPEEGPKAGCVVAHLQFYTSVLFISWVNSTLIVSALRAEALSSQAWNLAVCSSVSTVLDLGSRVALHLLETFLCSVVVGWKLLMCIFHVFSCVKTAASTFRAWYQPPKSRVDSHSDSRRCSVCLFISFDGLGLLALKLFCKLWE